MNREPKKTRRATEAVSAEDQVLIESELAEELATSSESDRPDVYSRMYDEMYELHLGRNPDVLEFGADLSLVPFLQRLTSPGADVVEIGCGTGLLAIELGRMGRTVIGVEVSDVALDIARERSS